MPEACVGSCIIEIEQDRIVPGNAEQPEADNKHSGNRAGLECDVKSRSHANGRGLSCPDIGTHGDMHADVTSSSGQDRSDDKADRDGHAKRQPENDRDNDSNDADGCILPVKIRRRAFLDRACNFLHPCGPGIRGQYRPDSPKSIEQGCHPAKDDKRQSSAHIGNPSFLLCTFPPSKARSLRRAPAGTSNRRVKKADSGKCFAGPRPHLSKRLKP